MQATKPRNHAIDRAKVLCAFLVIYAHLFDHDSGVRLYIYAFHMALFFLISGMFFKVHEDFWRGVASYARKMVVPAFFFDILFILIFTPLYHFGILPHTTKHESLLLWICEKIYTDFLLMFDNGDLFNGVVWFLFALFWCNVYLSIFERRKILGIIVPAAVYAGYVLFGVDLFYSVQGAMAFPFFFVGFKCKSLINKYTTSGKWMTYMGFFVLCLVVTACLTYVNGRVSFKGCRLGEYSVYISGPLFLLNGFVGTWMMIALASLIPVKGKWVTDLSKSLISTLGYQYLFIIPLHATPYLPTVWNAIPISIAILLGCHLLHQVTERFIPACIGR